MVVVKKRVFVQKHAGFAPPNAAGRIAMQIMQREKVLGRLRPSLRNISSDPAHVFRATGTALKRIGILPDNATNKKRISLIRDLMKRVVFSGEPESVISDPLQVVEDLVSHVKGGHAAYDFLLIFKRSVVNLNRASERQAKKSGWNGGK